MTCAVGNANTANICIARQAVAANRQPLVVFALTIQSGTIGVGGTRVDWLALPVTVIRIARIAESATVPGVTHSAATHYRSGGIVAATVRVTRVGLTNLARNLGANILQALESLLAILIDAAIDAGTCHANA